MNVVDPGEGLPMVTLVNVSSTFNLNLNLNTNKIAMTLKDLPVKLNKRKISGMILVTESKLTQRTASLFYENGTAILTGACYEEMSRMCAWSVVCMLNRFGIPADMRDFSINNITGHFKLDFKVNLTAAHEHMDCKSEYNKDYTAMRIRKVKGMGNMSCLVYPNGKCVVTGVKTREMIGVAVKWLYPRMKAYQHELNELDIPRFTRPFDTLQDFSDGRGAFTKDDDFWPPGDMAIEDDGFCTNEEGTPYMHKLPPKMGIKLFTKFEKNCQRYQPVTPHAAKKQKLSINLKNGNY